MIEGHANQSPPITSQTPSGEPSTDFSGSREPGGRQRHVEVMHGVNLGMLGQRDPTQYPTLTLQELERQIARFARQLNLDVGFFQSDFEGEFVKHLHSLRERADAVVLNPGAWTHYAWAIRDALEIAAIPACEVHLSDIHARESWRRVSVIEELCTIRIIGKGVDGYRQALEELAANWRDIHE